MFWSWWWAAVAGNVVENLANAFNDAVLLGQGACFIQRDPCAFSKVSVRFRPPDCTALTLIFSITTLNFLMHAILDVLLQASCSRRLVETGDFQNVSGVDPII